MWTWNQCVFCAASELINASLLQLSPLTPTPLDGKRFAFLPPLWLYFNYCTDEHHNLMSWVVCQHVVARCSAATSRWLRSAFMHNGRGSTHRYTLASMPYKQYTHMATMSQLWFLFYHILHAVLTQVANCNRCEDTELLYLVIDDFANSRQAWALLQKTGGDAATLQTIEDDTGLVTRYISALAFDTVIAGARHVAQCVQIPNRLRQDTIHRIWHLSFTSC